MNIIRTSFLGLCLVLPIALFGQSLDKYSQSITEKDISSIIEVLASDSLEGRDTGSKGLEKAKEFIVQHFRDYGLQPVVNAESGKSYTQPFILDMGSGIKSGALASGEKEYQHLKEALFIQVPSIGNPLIVDIVFVGEGNEEDYKGLDVKGKLALIWGGNFAVLNKTDLAKKRGARGCIVVPSKNASSFQSFMTRMGMYLSFSRASIRSQKDSSVVVAVSPETAMELMNISSKKFKAMMKKKGFSLVNFNKRLRANTIEIKVEKEDNSILTENILGFVEGSEFPEEVIVITAHYDHVGKKGDAIFNGADDNASGTTALMEVSEAFAIAAQEGNSPKRSVLFMALAAEEKGLLGSQYYADYEPIFPLENTVLNLNMDMVGHLDEKHDDPNFVCVIGSDWLSSELHEIHETANEKHVGLELDYTYNSKDHPERFYYRSDQYNFAKHNIPVIFYTSGDHEDYHQPSDTVDKIKTLRIQKIAQLVFYTAWEVANRDKRIVVDKTVD